MATSATPYGLKPIGLIGGQSYAGSTRQIKIASAYGTNIYNGSIVSVVAAGTLELVTTIGSAVLTLILVPLSKLSNNIGLLVQ